MISSISLSTANATRTEQKNDNIMSLPPGNDIDDSLQKNMRKTTGSPGLLFPVILHKILNESPKLGHEQIISWLPNGRAFKIYDRDEFVEKVLPIYYPSSSSSSSSDSIIIDSTNTISTTEEEGKSSNTNTSICNCASSNTTDTNTSSTTKQFKWKSFLRQINLYGFERITKSRHLNKKTMDKSELGAYTHKLFRRDNEALCCFIQRKDGKSKARRFLPLFAEAASCSMLAYCFSKQSDNHNNNNNQISKDFKPPTHFPPVAASIRRNVSTEETRSRSSVMNMMTVRGQEDEEEYDGDLITAKSDYPSSSSLLLSPSSIKNTFTDGTSMEDDYIIELNPAASATAVFVPPSSCYIPQMATGRNEAVVGVINHPSLKMFTRNFSTAITGEGPDDLIFWHGQDEKSREQQHEYHDLNENSFYEGNIGSSTARYSPFNLLDSSPPLDERCTMVVPLPGVETRSNTAAVTTTSPFASASVLSPTFSNQDGSLIGTSTSNLLEEKNKCNTDSINTNTTNFGSDNKDLPCNHRNGDTTLACIGGSTLVPTKNAMSNIGTSLSKVAKSKTMEELIVENESLLSMLLPGIVISEKNQKSRQQQFSPYHSSLTTSTTTQMQVCINHEHQESGMLEAFNPQQQPPTSNWYHDDSIEIPSLCPAPPLLQSHRKAALESKEGEGNSSNNIMEPLGLYHFQECGNQDNKGRDQKSPSPFYESIQFLARILEPDAI